VATIVIKDLSDSIELDREAMLSIIGGARSGGRPWQAGTLVASDKRIVDYPPGMGRSASPRKVSRPKTGSPK